MNTRKKAALTGAVVAIVFAVTGVLSNRVRAAVPDTAGLDFMKEGPVTVYHAPGNRMMAEGISRRASFHHSRIRKRLLLKEIVAVRVFVISNGDLSPSLAAADAGMPSWQAGVAMGGEDTIVIRQQPGETPSEHDEVIAHELTHIILRKDYPGAGLWPLWFREGLAMLQSAGAGLRHHRTLSWASITGRLLPLDELRYRFPEDERRIRLAYAESYSVLSFMITQYGGKKFDIFLSALRRNTLEGALLSSYGFGPGALESKWRRNLSRRYTWIPLLTGGTTFWLIAMAVFFTALYTRRLRGRRILREWEKEDENEGWM